MTTTPLNAEPRRVFIVDDHPVVRTGLKALIRLEPGMEVCGEAERVDEAIEKLDHARPHVILVDLALPGASGIDLIRYIKNRWVGVKVIVVSTYGEETYGPVATEAGADLYVNKHEAMDRITQAIHHVTDATISSGNASRKISHWFG